MPEVENIALGLRPVVVGRRVASVWVGSPIIVRGPERRHWRAFMAELTGRRIVSVARRAKRLILTAEGSLALVFQLGMTGKFLLPNPEEGIAAATPKHTRLILSFRDGTVLLFVDPRRFGRVWCLRDLDPEAPDATMEAAGLTPLGPEAFDLDPKSFAALLQTNRPIKSLLLDQSRIAGLGNIYADESLWAACIHPARAGSSLTVAEAATLLREIQKVLRRAIRAGGTTLSDFRNVYGNMGRFRNRLKAYGRQGEPCRRCGTPIQYLRVSGRGTHICPHCQGIHRRHRTVRDTHPAD
ncbi:MAG: bifunctional DNA-formamidopyrimidine glycosylase/DNA-(apurinic or apyrimidinic site) lyase [Planctomycetes bacterium]|nr:bifunctional DNA-formamidopyrimidine glycosylase/DNA-(apurinic or apyrimidinic site) lyase [Planctomycetota bacterium]